MLAVLLVLVVVFPDIKTLELPGGVKFERNIIKPGEDLGAQRDAVDRKSADFLRQIDQGGGRRE